MNEQRFPPGWDEKRVQQVLAHYENHTEDEEFAEIEATREDENITFIAVPTQLVSKVTALIRKTSEPTK